MPSVTWTDCGGTGTARKLLRLRSDHPDRQAILGRHWPNSLAPPLPRRSARKASHAAQVRGPVLAARDPRFHGCARVLHPLHRGGPDRAVVRLARTSLDSAPTVRPDVEDFPAPTLLAPDGDLARDMLPAPLHRGAAQGLLSHVRPPPRHHRPHRYDTGIQPVSCLHQAPLAVLPRAADFFLYAADFFDAPFIPACSTGISYFYNYLKIGVIVLYLHDLSDVRAARRSLSNCIPSYHILAAPHGILACLPPPTSEL